MLQRLILPLFFTFHAVAQLRGLSKYERCWALSHPFAALKVNSIGKRAGTIYRSLPADEPDLYNSGGKRDAFRHVFYMAAFAQRIKPRKLRKLGAAHERANYRQFLRALQEEGEIPDSLSSVMDLQNNELGFKMGRAFRNMDLDALKLQTLQAIRDGQAVIFKRTAKGVYTDCNDRPLLPQHLKQWSIPKCLVRSDYVYTD